MHRSTIRLRHPAALAPLVLLMIAGEAKADDVILVSVRNPTVEIAQDLLTANDPSSPAILSETDVRRGLLTPAHDHYVYQPDSTFFTVGLDSFRYASAAHPNFGSAVYLVAGLDRTLSADQPLQWQNEDCTLNAVWGITANREGASFLEGPGTVCAVGFDVTSGDETRLLAPEDIGPSPAGGHTDIVLDIGGGSAFGGGSDENSNLIAFATAKDDPDGPAIFGLRLIGEDELELVARRSDGTYVGTTAVSVGSGEHRIGITWWYEVTGSRDQGGIVLEVDEQIVGSRGQVDNAIFYGSQLAWQFGPRNLSGVGQFEMSDMSIWHSVAPARFPPQFADDGYEPMAWSRALDENELSWVATPSGGDEWHLDVRAGGGARLVDDTVDGLTHYQARVALGLEALSVPIGGRLNVFAASPQIGSGGGAVFRIELRRDALGVLQFRGLTASAGIEVGTPWISLPAGRDRPILEIDWEAASPGLGDGSFSLRVDHQRQTLEGLYNELVLRNVKVGPSFPQAGVDGTLILDAFDAWSVNEG